MLLPLGLAGQLRDAAASGGRVLPQDVQVSHDGFAAHSEPAIADNPANPLDLIAASKFFTDPKHYRFKIGTFYSSNGGRTWHDAGILPGFSAYGMTSDVSIAYDAAGVAYVCVLAVGANTSGIFVSRSNDDGKSFLPPVPVFLDQTGATFSDKPWIAVDQSKPHGNVYVAWNLDGSDDRADGASAFVAKQVSSSGNGLVISRSTDGGQSFSAPVVFQPFSNSQFPIGAFPAVGPDGTLYVAYSMDKNKSGKVDGLKLVKSSDGGVTFTAPKTISQVDGLPNHLPHGTFRNITLPALAVSPKDGALVVVWSDMRYGDADVLATTSRDGGDTWSQPVRVNHDRKGDGKDQFQPALAVAPDGIFTCAWLDRRRSRDDRLIDEFVAQSRDNGLSFSHNVRATRASWNPSIDAPEPEGKKSDTFIGDYQALAVDDQVVHPLWNDTQNGKNQQIRTTALSTSVFRY